MPKKGAFFYFMLDFKKKEEARGRKFSKLEEAQLAADPFWRKMSKEEKAPYEEKAKLEDQKAKQEKKVKINPWTGARSDREKYTSNGVPFSHIEAHEKDKARRISDQKLAVDEILQFAIQKGALEAETFTLLTFNYFIKDCSAKYYPCELGAVKFSLAQGVYGKCWSLINPGRLPTGFAYPAKDHAESTHNLPVPPQALGTSDYSRVLEELCLFLKSSQSSIDCDSNFFVFVQEEEEAMVMNILEQFYDQAGVPEDKNPIQTLPMKYLFAKLREKLEQIHDCQGEFPFTVTTAKIFFEQDLFRYNVGNGCTNHENPDVNFHCALGRVTRMAYVILGQTMDLAGICDKKPGFHFPSDVKVVEDQTEKSSKVQEKNEEEENDGFSVISQSTATTFSKEPMKDEFSDVSSYRYTPSEASSIPTKKSYKNRAAKLEEKMAEMTLNASPNGAGITPKWGNKENQGKNQKKEQPKKAAQQYNNMFKEDDFPSLG